MNHPPVATRRLRLGNPWWWLVAFLFGGFSWMMWEINAYNNAVGSLEGNVLVKARKLKEFQAVAAAAEEIPTLEPIDRVPRMLQAAELTDPVGEPDLPGIETPLLVQGKPETEI